MIYQDPTSSLNEVKKVSEILSEGLNNFKILEKERDHKLAKLEKELEVLERNHKLKHDHIAVIEEDVQRQLDKNIEQLRTKFRTADPEYKEQIKINKQRKELILKIEEVKKSLF
jgi:ABC-type antimicrobial peptide transport system ATPase subunit